MFLSWDMAEKKVLFLELKIHDLRKAILKSYTYQKIFIWRMHLKYSYNDNKVISWPISNWIIVLWEVSVHAEHYFFILQNCSIWRPHIWICYLV